MKIAIVVDMWLTGFDVPSLATMYVYKPMSGHNLMQAIARVNRVFRDKEGGLVVDYVGIASALKQAMKDYTARDQKNYGDTDIKDAAYPKFLEKLEVCRDFFFGYDYSAFFTGSDYEKAKAITGGTNFLLGKNMEEKDLPEKERTQYVYIKEALLLKQALTLCSSLVEEKIRFEAAYFEAVRTMLVRLSTGGENKKLTLPEVNERINELMKLAKDIADANAEGEKLGLNAEELAFYDALTKPQAIKDFYQNDELIAITKELTEMLRRNRTIDWQKKESARAGMRKMVKRLLRRYKYPPEGMEDAVKTVMSQCEMWTDNIGV